jgi:hypothetical protein
MVEFVGTLPILALGATICVQATLCALSLVFAQAAADRAARGATPAQASAALPSAWRSRATITSTGERIRVRVRPPAVLPGAGRLLRVTVSATKVTT